MATLSLSKLGNMWPKRSFSTQSDQSAQIPYPRILPPSAILSRLKIPPAHAAPLAPFGQAAIPAPEKPKPSLSVVAKPPVATAPAAPVAVAVTKKPEPKPQADLDLPTSVRLAAIDYQRRQQLMVSQLNRTLKAGSNVLVWNILPAELFSGEFGRFLMIACDFHAHGPGNTMLLPAMPAGSEEMSLPRHPFVVSDAQKADALRRVGLLHTKVADGHKRAALAVQQGDFSQVFSRTEQQKNYRQELADVVRSLAISSFGKTVWETHEKRFRAQINAL